MKKILALVIALVLTATVATVCVCADDAPSVGLSTTDVVVTDPVESETEAQKGGCRSSIGGAAIVVAAIGAAVALSKKEK